MAPPSAFPPFGERVDLAWDDGVLNVAAEHVDEDRGRRRTYHRRFRFPKDVDEDAISATYRNDVLEARLPVSDDDATREKATPSKSAVTASSLTQHIRGDEVIPLFSEFYSSVTTGSFALM